MKTDMMYEVLYGYSEIATEGVQLKSVKEVADFIITHDGGIIAEEDGTPFLEICNGEFAYCNDMQFKYEFISELRKNEGFENRLYKAGK